MSAKTKEKAHKATRHQDKIMGLFISSRKDAYQLIDQAMEGDAIPLEVAILNFFQTFRVGIYGRENLRKSIADDTDAEVDIGDPKVFKKLQVFFTFGSDREERAISGPKEKKRITNGAGDKAEKEAMKHFRDYFAIKVQPPLDVDGLIERAEEGDSAPLEEAVIEFFKECQPGIPLRNNLKRSILHQSEGRADLGHAASFRQLQAFYASVPKFRGESEGIVKVVRDRVQKTRARLMNNFREYCLSKSKCLNVDLLLENAMNCDYRPLESALVDFFSELRPGLRVVRDGKSSMIKRSNALAYMTHIKQWMLIHSQGKVDIGSPFMFKKLHEFYTARWLKNPEGSSSKPPKCERTERNRARIARRFTTYLASQDIPSDVDSLIKSAEDGNVGSLERGLIRFFKNKAWFGYKSHIKMFILEKTGGKVNISNSVSFEELNKFFRENSGSQPLPIREVMRKLQQAKPIPAETQVALHTLLGNLLSVLEARGKESYDRILLELPSCHHHTYHDLLRMAAVYIVVLCDVHRGGQSLAATRKDMYKKKCDPATGSQWFERTNRGGNFEIEFCGVIPFHSDKHGFNPGKLMDFYLSRLHPENSSLFQNAIKVIKSFDLHEGSSDNVPWYAANVSTGLSSIGQAITALCRLAGVPKAPHNRSVRATGIQMLEGLGYAGLIRSGDTSAQNTFDSDPDDELHSLEYDEDRHELLTKPDLGQLIEEVVDQEGIMDQ